MPSSIFSSRKLDSRAGVLLLAAVLALACGMVELAGSVGVPRLSRIQRRIASTYKSTVALQPHDAKGRPTLVVLGNSLPLFAIDIGALQQRFPSRFAVSGYFVEQTGSLDWYYGLRRLFAEGSRPRVMVLSLDTNSLFETRIRDEYFAYFMLRTRDFPDLAKRLAMRPTPASNLLFANLSAWFGTKADMRKFALLHTLPNLDELAKLIAPGGPKRPEPAVLGPRIEERLSMLDRVCDEYGTLLVVVIPPTQDLADPYALNQAAGRAAHVPVLVPSPPGELPASDYLEDGFHMNSRGAMQFTQALADQLDALPELNSVR
jgi:hypothetical protein